MKWLSLTMIIFLLLVVADYVSADGNYNNITTNSIETSQAMALAVSEINPTLLSSKWQVGVGFGIHNDSTAIAIGLAKRVNKNLLFSGKIANQDGDIGTSIGLNFKF